MEHSPLLVARAVIKDDKHLFLVRRAASDSYQPGLWEFPGGKIDAGETLEVGLEREVSEETGLIVTVDSKIAAVSHEIVQRGKYEGRLYVALFLAAQRIGGEVRLSEEHDASGWFGPGDIWNIQLSKESRQATRTFKTTGLL